MALKTIFYYTLWEDRIATRSVENQDGDDDIIYMTGINQNKFRSNTKAIFGKFLKAFENKTSALQQFPSSDQSFKVKEAIRCERLGLLEDSFLLSISKDKQIQTRLEKNQ